MANGTDHGEELCIRLLGPVTGRRCQPVFSLGTPRQQAFISILASQSGQIVSLSELIDGIWGEDPPRSAKQSVYTYIAGLRRALEPTRKRHEPSELLIGTAGGYLLQGDRTRVDSLLLARHLEQARLSREAEDHLQALASLNQALALWQGRP